jgi:4'-phosphopantetheinyl transferase
MVADGAGSPAPADLLPLLDESEAERARRLSGSGGEARFVRARAAARVILGRLLEVAPREVPITADRHGKPALEGGGICFSISHTEGLILVAVSEAGPVGVDVETVERRPPRPGLQRRALTDSELRALEALPPAARQGAFLQAWSRKEAYAKGVGRGIGLDFRTIEVGWDGPAVTGEPAWEVRSLPLPQPHVGAVAAPGSGWPVQIDSFGY